MQRDVCRLSASKSFGLVRVGSFRGRVHVVSTDTADELLGAHVLLKKNNSSLFDGNARCDQKTYYVYRSQRLKYGVYHVSAKIIESSIHIEAPGSLV